MKHDMTETIQQEVKTFDLDKDQIRAVEACCDLSKRIVAVTGSAGTGKTSIMKQVYEHLYEKNVPTALCAPTGKASKRITEATGVPAVTQHRLLEYPHPGELDEKTGKPLRTTDPKRDRFNPLEYKVVLADEYAMCNSEVHRNLIDALPPGGCIRMFGDVNQLQPIEPNKALQDKPSPFMEMLEKFEGINLHTIHRQAEGSSIIENGQRITMGQMPKRTDDFVIRMTDDPVDVLMNIMHDAMGSEDDFRFLENQIITPTKVGWVGTDALNSAAQQLFQPVDKLFFEIERHKWAKTGDLRIYEDDKVIFTVNNYALGIFNGETGLVKEMDEMGSIVVDFGDKIISIPPMQEVETNRGDLATINPQKDLDLAYVITTHKSQGSEYRNVLYAMNSSRQYLLNRKNFYTGISRARERVTVVTDQKALQFSLFRKSEPRNKK